MPSRDSTPDNVSELRQRIDSGRTGDKVAFPDPAAAPLGTDAEAGGKPPSQARAAKDQVPSASGQRAAGLTPDQAGIVSYVLVAGAVYLGILAIVASA